MRAQDSIPPSYIYIYIYIYEGGILSWISNAHLFQIWSQQGIFWLSEFLRLDVKRLFDVQFTSGWIWLRGFPSNKKEKKISFCRNFSCKFYPTAWGAFQEPWKGFQICICKSQFLIPEECHNFAEFWHNKWMETGFHEAIFIRKFFFILFNLLNLIAFPISSSIVLRLVDIFLRHSFTCWYLYFPFILLTCWYLLLSFTLNHLWTHWPKLLI